MCLTTLTGRKTFLPEINLPEQTTDCPNQTRRDSVPWYEPHFAVLVSRWAGKYRSEAVLGARSPVRKLWEFRKFCMTIRISAWFRELFTIHLWLCLRFVAHTEDGLARPARDRRSALLSVYGRVTKKYPAHFLPTLVPTSGVSETKKTCEMYGTLESKGDVLTNKPHES